MRAVWFIVGALAIIIGIVWTLQGLNLLGGSGMSGHVIFAVIGVIVAIIGVVLIVVGVQRRQAPSA